jgi:quinoprotein glucose dehydrogenase
MKSFNSGIVLLGVLMLSACGGGGGGGGNGSTQAPETLPPSSGGSPAPTACTPGSGPFSAVFPQDNWQTSSPEDQGLCSTNINDALDYAFKDGNDTGAVIIVKNGYLVAEQYGPNKTSEDQVTSWSVAKSVTSALVGAALDEGAIRGLDQSLADFIPSWSSTGKAAITVSHLLNVRTAMDLIGDPDGDGYPDGSDLYESNDQLALSLNRPLIGTPGEKLYTYSNADVMIAGELVRVATGVPVSDYLANTLGDVTGFNGDWWVDSNNQVLAYCCLDAKPRSFARFGLLYARNGAWNGTQLLSQAWINTSTIPARNGTYGYYWWPISNGGFAAIGVQGQLIAVYPDNDLVVLRFGNYTRQGDGSIVRSGNNFHDTNEPTNFDIGTFLDLAWGGLLDESYNVSNTQAPIADLGVNQVSVLGSEVTVHAGKSLDPDGNPLTFDWELASSPKGSTALIEGIGETLRFTPNVSGTYVVNLTLSDGQNSSTTEQTITIVPSRDVLTEGTANGMWPNYGGNLSSNKYAPHNQVNADNIDELEIAWRWLSPDNNLTTYQNSVFEPTPIMVDGVLYTSTSFSQVAAINATTGESLWTYDPQSYLYGRPPNNGFLHRGVSFTEDSNGKKIHIATGDARLIALNAISGKPINNFGTLGNGQVNLLSDIPRLNATTTRLNNAHDQPDVPDLAGAVTQVGNSSPGIMCRNVLIVGSSVHDGEVLPPSPPGDVRGFDINTGERLWTFHTIPRKGEFGLDTWQNDSWKINGNTNVWAPMSADEELGHVYLPVSCPTNNYYGGRRPGDNLFANSIVALNCETGEREWHFQTVHHDIWDYDLPAAPNLMDINVDGVNIKALAQVSKQGFIYVFDRETGAPVWPIIETPVPGSTVPGEITSLTQPIPSKPPPFVRQGSARQDLVDPSSATAYDVGPLFTPPNTKGLIVTPGEGGGANWGGASYDPNTQTLYVNGFGPLSHLVRLQEGSEENFYYVFPELFTGPATVSPYPGLGSSITAYDMNAGSIRWQVAADSNTTVIGNAASMVSGDLLFYKNSSLSTLNVFDKTTGVLLRKIPLGARPTGSPMTYMQNGKQYIVIAAGRQDETMELIALSLP